LGETTAMKLNTRYLGLDLASPLVASAGPLSQKLDGIRQLEDAGASAVVLFSLFEEQLALTPSERLKLLAEGSGHLAEALARIAESDRLQFTPLAYLEHIQKAKQAVSIPIIASLNGAPHEGWVHFAKLVEQAGADALELNLYAVETDPDRDAQAVERDYIRTIQAVRRELSIPLAVKLTPYFSSLPAIARRMTEAGANALVCFNRFYQPDINLSDGRVRPTLHLSTSNDLRLPLRWIAILRGQIKGDLAASGGIHQPQDALKMLMVGADVVMLCSTLLSHGLSHIRTIESGIRIWLEARDYRSIDDIRGMSSREKHSDPSAFERGQYMLSLDSYDASVSDSTS
jgi:dihydroorotate dehydrogenase (fumarate)